MNASFYSSREVAPGKGTGESPQSCLTYFLLLFPEPEPKPTLVTDEPSECLGLCTQGLLGRAHPPHIQFRYLGNLTKHQVLLTFPAHTKLSFQ